MRLRPDSVVHPHELERGKQILVRDAAWATLAGALYGGVILVGFAVALGASPIFIGVLAAIPFLAQVAQLPAIALVERLRQRRKDRKSTRLNSSHAGLSRMPSSA